MQSYWHHEDPHLSNLAKESGKGTSLPIRERLVLSFSGGFAFRDKQEETSRVYARVVFRDLFL